MNVLEKILEELEERLNMVESIPVNEDDDFLDGEECYEDGRTQGRFKELLWCRDIIRSHMDEARDINVPSNVEIEPASEEFLKDCAETAARYKRNFGNWIPVEEGLPEEGQKVLVWYEYFRYGEYNRMFKTYGIGWQFDGHWSGDVSGTKARCIAWQPLPEQYRSEKS